MCSFGLSTAEGPNSQLPVLSTLLFLIFIRINDYIQWVLKMIPTTTSGALQMIDEDDILVIVSRIAQRDLFVLYVKIEYIFSFVLR